MPKYQIICPVTSAQGSQYFVVNAANETEALALHEAGNSRFEHEEIEVTSLGKPEVEEIEW